MLKTGGLDLQEAGLRVLAHPTVASKNFLVTIGDRSVGGLTAREQMVGPWQLPVADVAITLADFDGVAGEAMSIGERTPLALLDAVGVQKEAAYVLATSTTGYTTNLPLEHLRNGQAWVAWEADGKPLSREHGGPVRLLVPHLYFWKSAKWISRLELMTRDLPGVWERNGYHDRGDPWLEQRYQGDP